MNNRLGLLLLPAVLLWVTVRGQNPTRNIDSLVNSLNKEHALSGNVLIAQDGKVIYRHAYGPAVVNDGRPVNDATTFLLASLAKPFTATAILQLKEKGKLKLDDAVIQYLPDFPYRQITIRQLLTHTSGLVDLQIFEAPYKADTAKVFSNADVIPAIRADQHALLAQPGEKYSYSNTNYALLVLIVEKISGRAFPDYLQRYVFGPASMTHTYIRTQLIDQRPNDSNRSENYDFPGYAPDHLVPAKSIKKYRISLVNLGGLLGPDGVASTEEDLLRFDEALYSNKLLKPATLQEAFTPGKLTNGQPAAGGGGKLAWYQGLGWMILRDTTDGKVVFHPGGNIGAVTILLRNIDKRQTVIVLDNETHRGVHETGVDLLNLLNGRQLVAAKRSAATAYVRALYAKGTDYAVSRFNSLRSDTAAYYLNENEFNSLGYELLNDGHREQALEVLRMTTLLYPNSWNAFDSYGELLLALGKKEEAIEMYQLSLRLNPHNEGGRKVLQQLGQKK
ncbi:serine hydrolase [Mucilaginibacter ximonensis]|uniref:Serine hydrolase n=1 Tax=Mucilaginibacter ximonensis TaxID=538021 RepID=A0ABW5Y9J1_9SPHI